MESIAAYIKDPGWWFSAVFVAIIASIFAGFLKDNIEKLLSNIFTGLKAWRATREERRRIIIESLLKDKMYFVISLFRAAIGVTIFTLFTLIYMSAPIFLSTAPASSTIFSAEDIRHVIWNIITPILGLLNITISYKTATRMSIVFEAAKEYRIRNNLPKFL
ncbi:hypothetical protein [Pseudomonas tumuqii]|uniref:hypothetical protein n=1 Tax=Pseudomonas tumuqii TaxID=2715755 RepID=UPI0015524348|nr:hypothetical protein [Pseudomonas tumuqii]